MRRHALLAGLLVSAGVAACNGCHANPPKGPATPVAPDGPPTVRLYFVSDLAGAIEPCGCVKDQLGGLDHAAAWIDAQKKDAPASLLVAAGPTFFMDPFLEKDHRSQDVAKADALASSLQHLGFSGWAPSTNDWADGTAELVKLAQLSGAPALLANVHDVTASGVMATRVVAVNALRIGLIGAGMPPSDPAGAPTSVAASPPLPPSADAVRAASASLRADGANLVILLASVGRGEAKRIADAVPDLTAIVVGAPSGRGDSNTPSPPAERVGNVLIAETANHLQTVGAIDFYVRKNSYVFADATGLDQAQRRAELTRRIDDLHNRVANWEQDKKISKGDLDARRADLAKLEAERAGLDATPAPAEGSYLRYTLKEVRDSLGQDAAVKSALGSYYRLVNENNRVQLEGRLPPEPAPGQPSYIGVDACATCHKSEKKFWEKTQHANAYATLSTQSKEFNLDCVGCHVTGYGKAGGSTVTHVDRLKDVQCEVCHGPGSIHAGAPTQTKLTMPSAELCTSCHHAPHVEGFDAVSKMALVVGPGHQ